MKILFTISLLPFLSLGALSETVDIKLTPLMQTEGLASFNPVQKIVFQASTKSAIELFSAKKAYVFAEKSSWKLGRGSLKKDIKTGDLIFNLLWKSETHPVPKKISETIELSYASKKIKKETHDITKPKGEINLEGFLLSYEISKDPRRKVIQIKFKSKEYIIIQGLQLFGDDNKAIKRLSSSGSGGFRLNLSIRVGTEEAKQLKKVSFLYYPGPYKTVKVPIEVTLPL